MESTAYISMSSFGSMLYVSRWCHGGIIYFAYLCPFSSLRLCTTRSKIRPITGVLNEWNHYQSHSSQWFQSGQQQPIPWNFEDRWSQRSGAVLAPRPVSATEVWRLLSVLNISSPRTPAREKVAPPKIPTALPLGSRPPKYHAEQACSFTFWSEALGFV